MICSKQQQKNNETNATLDDLETFALYSGPEERLPCYYDLPQKEADEKAEEKAAPKKRPSRQRPKITHAN